MTTPHIDEPRLSWRTIYGLVLGWLIVLIVGMKLFGVYFA